MRKYVVATAMSLLSINYLPAASLLPPKDKMAHANPLPKGKLMFTDEVSPYLGDSLTFLDVMAKSYEITVTINGKPASDKAIVDSYSGTIKGGVKKGKNTIVIHLKLRKDKKPSSIEVSVRITVDEEDDDKIVFDLKEAHPEEVITKEFEVE